MRTALLDKRSRVPASIAAALCVALAVSCSDTDDPSPPSGASQAQAAVEKERAEKLLLLGMKGAERVVVGTVTGVEARFAEAERGGRLILSTVTLDVRESLRGEAHTTISFELEGGRVGDIALDVSDLPKLKPGDRGVFLLRRGLSGNGWVRNRRDLGILLTDIDGDLTAVRQAERATR